MIIDPVIMKARSRAEYSTISKIDTVCVICSAGKKASTTIRARVHEKIIILTTM